MKEVNKTMYIPLYGKSYVSQKGIILVDKIAEEIWEKEQFKLKRKSKSKWLAYYMSIRSKVFDEWVKEQLSINNDVVVLHLGCGMDSRIKRVGDINVNWFDIDFLDVIEERKKYYDETNLYKMISADIRETKWLNNIPITKTAIIILEGISMYLTNDEIKDLFTMFDQRFTNVRLLMDCYSGFAAKMSKFKNPVNDVGVTQVFGVDDPNLLSSQNLIFLKKHDMIPQKYIFELKGFERFIFKKLYAGSISKRLYKLYEFRK